MPWIQLGVAAVGMYMGHKAKKKAEKQQNAANAMSEEEIAMQREGLDFSKQQYSDWQEKFDPAYDRMMSEIDQGITPDYAAIAGDVNSSFDTAQGMERRQMQRYGIKPTDGAARHSEREYGIKRSTAHSGIRNQARQQSKGILFDRLKGVTNSLQGVQTGLSGQVGSSYSRVGASQSDYATNLNKQSGVNYDRDMKGIAGMGTAIGGVDWKGLWGSVKGWSDERLKENIQLLGVHDGINIYSWDWNDNALNIGVEGPTVGVMAQEHIESGFVSTGDEGYLKVDYNGLFDRRVH